MRDVVEALGGVLIVSAVFGDTQVVLQTMDKPKGKTPTRAASGSGKALKRGSFQSGDFAYPVVSRARQGTAVRDSSSGQFVTKDKSKRVKAKHPNLKKT